MNEFVFGLKQDLIKFFVEGVQSASIITSLKYKIGFYSLEVANNGNTEINKKNNKRFSYIISSNIGDTEMVMFVYENSTHEDFASISLYCIRDEKVFEFKTKDNKTFVPIKKFKGVIGSDIINAIITFKNGGLPISLSETKEGIGYDIIEYKRNLF